MTGAASTSRAERGIVDAHVHFWDPRGLEYPWLAAIPALARPFGPREYREATAHVPVRRLLFVEGNCLPEENTVEVEQASFLGEQEPRLGGIVAFADVAAHGARALDAFDETPLVRGVRQNVQGRAPGFCLAPPFVEGVREAGRRGLVFDLCATHDQLADVVSLAERCPDTRLVLDHCGKPPIRASETEPWASHVTRLAASPHVACKISGLLTEAAPNATDADLLPYADHAAACFGADRIMYGSDWPVLTLAGTYDDWYGFTTRLTSSWSEDARGAFYHDNAMRVYGL